jgi:PRTRC genetic system protein E
MNGFSFKLLEQYLNNTNMNIVITKNDNVLSVSLLPQPKCKDEAFKALKPIVLKGTAEELDAEFHKIIQKPLDKVAGIVSNVISFEESADKSAAETKAATEIKDKAKKDKEKAEKKVEKAKEYLEKKDFDKAMFTINEALNLSPKLSSAGKIKTEIETAKAASSQVGLFGGETPVVHERYENEEEDEEVHEPTSMKEVAIEEQQEAENTTGIHNPLEDEQSYEDVATRAVMNHSENAVQEPNEEDELEARDMFESERNGYDNVNPSINFG